MRPRHAFTLPELLLVLALAGTLLSVAMPALGRWRDAAAVRAARADLLSALARTRVAAEAAGGAALVVDPATHRVWIRTAPGDTIERVDLRARYGVSLHVDATGPVEIRYDALGIGRLANRSIELRRRRVAGGVTVSAYGRARPW